MAWENTKPYPIELGGLNASADPSTVYPLAIAATNVRFGRFGGVMKRLGHTTYNSTAMPATTRAITGVAQFNLRDTTTRYTIVGTQEKLFVCPTSSTWTTLASSLGAGVNDYWDFAVFNNELICCNGVTEPRWTDGTAAGTVKAARVWRLMTFTSVAFTIRAPAVQGYAGGTGILGGGLGSTMVPFSRVLSADYVTNTAKELSGMSSSRAASACNVLYEHLLVSAGYTGPTGSQTILATQTGYNPATDVWDQRTSKTTAVVWPAFFIKGSQDTGFAVGGSTTGPGNNNYPTTGANGVANNEEHNVVTDTWATRTAITTARTAAAAANIGAVAIVAGGLDTSTTSLTDTRGYDTLTDTWSALTGITAARHMSSGLSGPGDNRFYNIGGRNSANPASGTTTLYSYLASSDAWTTEAALPNASSDQGAFAASTMLVAAGAGGGSAVWAKFGATPSAPTAFYVESYKGYLLLARTSDFPSRVYYSVAGESHEWMNFNYFDVNPDDGDWITGLFVFGGRLYVTKTDTIYEIAGTVFDPVEGDTSIIPLENIKGTVSNRSIVVTDRGVFYLAEDGFRMFDGSRSVLIGEAVQTTLDGYVQSRLKYTAGVWVRSRDELWWSVTSTGSTHDTLLVFNMKHGKWSIFTGMNCEAIATVEDASDIEQILFGTGSAADGKLYKAESGNNDNTASIASTYQTGWFSPATGLNLAEPKDLYLWWKRVSTTAPVVSLRSNYSSSDPVEAGVTLTDTVTLTAASSNYFEDAADQRCRIPAPAVATSHAMSLRITETSTNAPWELYLAALTAAQSPADGGFPT